MIESDEETDCAVLEEEGNSISFPDGSPPSMDDGEDTITAAAAIVLIFYFKCLTVVWYGNAKDIYDIISDSFRKKRTVSFFVTGFCDGSRCGEVASRCQKLFLFHDNRR